MREPAPSRSKPHAGTAIVIPSPAMSRPRRSAPAAETPLRGSWPTPTWPRHMGIPRCGDIRPRPQPAGRVRRERCARPVRPEAARRCPGHAGRAVRGGGGGAAAVRSAGRDPSRSPRRGMASTSTARRWRKTGCSARASTSGSLTSRLIRNLVLPAALGPLCPRRFLTVDPTTTTSRQGPPATRRCVPAVSTEGHRRPRPASDSHLARPNRERGSVRWLGLRSLLRVRTRGCGCGLHRGASCGGRGRGAFPRAWPAPGRPGWRGPRR